MQLLRQSGGGAAAAASANQGAASGCEFWANQEREELQLSQPIRAQHPPTPGPRHKVTTDH